MPNFNYLAVCVLAVGAILALAGQSSAWNADGEANGDDTGWQLSGGIGVRAICSLVLGPSTSSNPTQLVIIGKISTYNEGSNETSGATTQASASLPGVNPTDIWIEWNDPATTENPVNWISDWGTQFDGDSVGASNVAPGCEFIGVYEVFAKNVVVTVNGSPDTGHGDHQYAESLIDNDAMPHTTSISYKSGSKTSYGTTAPVIRISASLEAEGSWVGSNDSEYTYVHTVQNPWSQEQTAAWVSGTLRMVLSQPKIDQP